MDRILFFDTSCSGHRSRYDFSLIKGVSKDREVLFVTKATNNMQDLLEKEGIRYKHITTARKHHLLHDFSLLIKMVRIANSEKMKHIHLLYLDSLLILLLFMWPLIFLFKFKVTATLHWYPNRTLKKILLKGLVRGNILERIVVHGDYTKNNILKLLGPTEEEKVFSIPYPNLHDSSQSSHDQLIKIEDKPNTQHLERPFLLLFGGLRYDKGLDLLIESVKKVKNRNYTLFIIGKEEHFDRQFIEEKLEETAVKDNIILKLGFVPDEEVPYYFGMTDAVVLPYRKVFSGQSGPLTEGVANRKFIIGPNHGELGYTINKYKLGLPI